MVCKINFDYEVLLSDDNDSISSPHLSSDEEGFGKKFVLGDNIRNVNPLEIFSVRQLNDFTPTNLYEPVSDLPISMDDIVFPKVPVNDCLHYDESISNFDEESVTESECDLYSGSPISQNKESHSSPKPLKYNLPTVNRFQMVLATDPPKDVSSVSKYCLNEKQRRLQTEIVKKSNKNGQQISDGKRSNIGGHDKSIPWKTPANREIVSRDRIDDSIITPEILSQLSVDMLAAFIDGEKPLHEIVDQMNNNHNERLIQCKKAKRQKPNKRSNKHPKSSSLSDIPLQNRNSSESSGKNKRKNQRKNSVLDTEATDRESLLDDLPTIASHMHIYDDAIIDAVAGPCEDSSNISQISAPSTSHDPIQVDIPHYTLSSSINIPKIVNSNLIDNNAITDSENTEFHGMTDSENIPDSPSNLALSIADNNDDHEDHKASTGNDQLLYEEKPYEDLSCNNVLADGCSDNRTSSTDSGFHEIDSFDSNDESHCVAHKDSVRTGDAIQELEQFPSNIELSQEADRRPLSRLDCNHDAQYRPVDEFIDLSSFKYKFINESDLVICGTGSTIVEDHLVIAQLENDGTILETCHVANGNDSCSEKSMTIAELFMDMNNPDKPGDIDYYCNDHSTNAESINNESDRIVFHKPPNPISGLVNEAADTDGVVYSASCDPFQMNYYCPESSIDNRQQISQFLNYQWLKFCEKYTMSSHQLMML